jgi:UDP-N-acetylglucosamine--N-acetylmuramyl-(pentapeptide) pyrophosphoryl-undecaprenol N-acetylglucosamine transferase
MSAATIRVLIAGGGTGGHLYPGIAVARTLVAREPGAVVTFVGTTAGIEARVVPREGFELDTIRSAGLKGKSPAQLARGLALLPLSAADAWRVLTRRAPHVVVGLGGYSSGPVILLGWLRGIPTIVLEQNAVPGLANRLLAWVVRAAAVTYDATLPYFGRKGFVSGNPVRREFFEVPPRPDRPGAVKVLIFGGSQGAHAINMAMVEAAPGLAAGGGRMAVTHQTGERDVALVREAYERAKLGARVVPFLHDMDREMSEADLVVSRAGATTLAELAAAGRAAILVPLPTATDDHQRRNAEELARAGAAEVIDQRELTGAVLAGRILALADDPARLARMREAIRRFARPNAAETIVNRVMALAGRP